MYSENYTYYIYTHTSDVSRWRDILNFFAGFCLVKRFYYLKQIDFIFCACVL